MGLGRYFYEVLSFKIVVILHESGRVYSVDELVRDARELATGRGVYAFGIITAGFGREYVKDDPQTWILKPTVNLYLEKSYTKSA